MFVYYLLYKKGGYGADTNISPLPDRPLDFPEYKEFRAPLIPTPALDVDDPEYLSESHPAYRAEILEVWFLYSPGPNNLTAKEAFLHYFSQWQEIEERVLYGCLGQEYDEAWQNYKDKPYMLVPSDSKKIINPGSAYHAHLGTLVVDAIRKKPQPTTWRGEHQKQPDGNMLDTLPELGIAKKYNNSHNNSYTQECLREVNAWLKLQGKPFQAFQWIQNNAKIKVYFNDERAAEEFKSTLPTSIADHPIVLSSSPHLFYVEYEEKKHEASSDYQTAFGDLLHAQEVLFLERMHEKEFRLRVQIEATNSDDKEKKAILAQKQAGLELMCDLTEHGVPLLQAAQLVEKNIFPNGRFQHFTDGWTSIFGSGCKKLLKDIHDTFEPKKPKK